jgi:hypothetical protein
MRPEDAVWNRACDWYANPSDAGPGDLALRDMIYFNGLAMNGGPLHAWETAAEDGTTAALAAYRFFDLEEAASVVAWLLDAVKTVDLADADAAESVELQANERYYAAVPDDEVLVAAFEATYGQSPASFVPAG